MNSNLIYRVPKLYSKQSCKKLINFFDNNVSKATKGRYGDKKLDNLEITIDIIRSQDWFNLGEALMKGINNYKKQLNQSILEIQTELSALQQTEAEEFLN